MKEIRAFANYGVLAHEKQTIFTFGEHEHATVCEEVKITLPDGWRAAKGKTGMALIITPDGVTYTADEIISSYGDNPVLEWYDGNKDHRITLEWSTL